MHVLLHWADHYSVLSSAIGMLQLCDFVVVELAEEDEATREQRLKSDAAQPAL